MSLRHGHEDSSLDWIKKVLHNGMNRILSVLLLENDNGLDV